MARLGKIIAWTAVVVVALPVVLVGLVLIAGNTDPGRHLIERLVPSLTGGEIHLAGLAGRFPDRLRAKSLALSDKDGRYLTINDLTFDWSPLRLLHRVLEIDHLDAGSADFARMPVSSGSSSSSSSNLPVQVTLQELHIDRLHIGAPVAGHSFLLSVAGAASLASYTAGSGKLTVHRLDGGGDYRLDGSIDASRIHAAIAVQEPAQGLISGLAGLPNLGPVSVDARLDGPTDAVATRLDATAGALQAKIAGKLDLAHKAANLTIAASAPAMSPRPDIAWQDVSVAARMQGPFTAPELSGQVRIDALKAEGAGVARLVADITGNAGTAKLHATVAGLTLPGQDPTLFAAAPVVLDATARLDAPDRPVDFTLQHPLVQAHGTARTAGAMAAHVVLDLPDLAPVAAAGGQTVQGRTALTLDVTRSGATTNVALNGTIGITGGQKQAAALLGDAATIDLAASLTGHDAELTRLHVNGRGADVTAHGGLVQSRANLQWTIAISNLAALEPTLTGKLDAAGTVSGPENDLAASADLHGNIGAQGVESGPVAVHVQANGLPSHPSGTVTAQGALLNAPIDVAMTVSRSADGALDLSVQRAAWKSLHAGGAMTLPAGATMPQGTLHLQMAQLGDLSPLLARKLAGSIDAALDANADRAKLRLDARGLALPGTAAVSQLALAATVDSPQHDPTVHATLAMDGVSAGSLTGAVKLAVNGPQNALATTLAVNAPDLSGAPAQVNAAATIDVPARALTLASFTAAWHGQELHLLAPARLDAANGASIDHLRLGLQQAVVEVNGRVSPSLDLTATLRNLPADLAAVVAPSVAAAGTISADARLTGSTAHPQGTIRLVANGLRDRSGPGQAIPPANITANATLDGTDARLDARLTAGSSRLTLTGTAPLAATGALDLHAGGVLDLAMLNPILSAEGRRVRGQLALDAAIAGTTAAPRISGTARLTGGEAQDYPMGVHVTDIVATLQADGTQVRLVQFKGRAGDGTIGGSGTIGLSAPMPVNLTFTADNARPLASDLMTASIDSHLTVRGNVDGTLAAAGTLHVRRAEIRVPDKMPSSVAVLQVRNANAPPPGPGHRTRPVARAAAAPKPVPATGAAAAPPPAVARIITLDITLDAPQQVFIRGRGLDVELGGRVHIGGTAANPLPSGGLSLRRGTLSVVGQTLTFTEGSIDFSGAGIADPNIRLVATSTNNSITATLTVSGSASSPKVTLSSVPDLPQDEILAQLLFHQSVGTLSPFQVAAIAGGLAELSGATSGVGDPLGSLRKSLGLDRLSVGSGSTGSPTLEAGRYLAPGVYLGAKQSATGNGTQASVQIDITKGLKLETTAGTATASATGAASSGEAASVGLTYQFQY